MINLVPGLKGQILLNGRCQAKNNQAKIGNLILGP